MRKKVCTVTIKDCDVQTFRAGGPGGQKQNKTNSGVRIKHRASGAVGESREHRTQLQNKRSAFQRMARTAEFTRWAKVEAGIVEVIIDQWVDDQMKPENLIIEYL